MPVLMVVILKLLENSLEAFLHVAPFIVVVILMMYQQPIELL